jgi:hypothetical protein
MPRLGLCVFWFAVLLKEWAAPKEGAGTGERDKPDARIARCQLGVGYRVLHEPRWANDDVWVQCSNASSNRGDRHRPDTPGFVGRLATTTGTDRCGWSSHRGDHGLPAPHWAFGRPGASISYRSRSHVVRALAEEQLAPASPLPW